MTDRPSAGSGDPLAGFVRGSFTHAGVTHDTYRRGSGPGVIVIHEMPGLTPRVAGYANEVADAGFTVVCPSLFGTPGRAPTRGYLLGSLLKGCVSSEFHALAIGRTSPATTWCRALAAELHRECGGPGVGAIGMCFTGGFALAMLLDDHTVAPVLSQPSLPMAVGRRRAADLGLSPEDLDRVVERVAAGCDVLGLRYTGDKAVGTRFETLRRLLGERFEAIELPGSKHSVVTEHRDDEAVARTISFFREKLAA
ncbi:MAG: dienelactone hydrolase family protein [Acidimicrobiales bacterium]